MPNIVDRLTIIYEAHGKVLVYLQASLIEDIQRKDDLSRTHSVAESKLCICLTFFIYSSVYNFYKDFENLTN